MKTVVYIEDGVVQLVLTPENEFEKNAFKAFKPVNGVINASFYEGEFYDCQGGWSRRRGYEQDWPHSGHKGNNSLIIRTEAKTESMLPEEVFIP